MVHTYYLVPLHLTVRRLIQPPRGARLPGLSVCRSPALVFAVLRSSSSERSGRPWTARQAPAIRQQVSARSRTKTPRQTFLTGLSMCMCARACVCMYVCIVHKFHIIIRTVATKTKKKKQERVFNNKILTNYSWSKHCIL